MSDGLMDNRGVRETVATAVSVMIANRDMEIEKLRGLLAEWLDAPEIYRPSNLLKRTREALK